jgi:hypothetical protein
MWRVVNTVLVLTMAAVVFGPNLTLATAAAPPAPLPPEAGLK